MKVILILRLLLYLFTFLVFIVFPNNVNNFQYPVMPRWQTKTACRSIIQPRGGLWDIRWKIYSLVLMSIPFLYSSVSPSFG